ncbi:MAG TPA: LuxR C-terminal-related transcriptional regulator [Phycisphaerales bacterium]|nr:LuxR C-terminal-related transcriptional regulator [Phycisphaerales bacterium]
MSQAMYKEIATSKADKFEHAMHKSTNCPTADAAWLWQTFVDESSMPIFVVNHAGTVEMANLAGTQLLRNTAEERVVGRSLADLLGEDHARERLEHIQSVLNTGRTIVFEEMRRGKQIRCVMRAIPTSGNAKSVLVTAYISALHAPFQNGYPTVRAKNNDAGKLSNLTTREVEILKLIGLGLSTIDIAKHLGRSVKTIEWHRVSLGEKLGVVNRVELARIAIAAGLVGLDERAPLQSSAKD